MSAELNELAEQWTIAMGDNFYFDIVAVKPRRRGDVYVSDADLNGLFPTKLAAIEHLIACQNETRAALNHHIARAKRMRSALRSKAASQ